MWETWVRSLGQEDSPGEGYGNPLQYSCLENPMDGGAWWATVQGVAKSRTWLSNWTTKTIPLMQPSLASSSLLSLNFLTRWLLSWYTVYLSVYGHLLPWECMVPCKFNPWVRKIPWRRKWQPTPVFLPGDSHGWRSLVGYSPGGRKESDTNEQLHFMPLVWKMGSAQSALTKFLL